MPEGTSAAAPTGEHDGWRPGANGEELGRGTAAHNNGVRSNTVVAGSPSSNLGCSTSDTWGVCPLWGTSSCTGCGGITTYFFLFWCGFSFFFDNMMILRNNSNGITKLLIIIRNIPRFGMLREKRTV